MGQHVCRISCDRCQDCSNSGNRCASLCYGASKKAPVVQTFNFESGKSPQINYPIVGEENHCSQVGAGATTCCATTRGACGDCGEPTGPTEPTAWPPVNPLCGDVLNFVELPGGRPSHAEPVEAPEPDGNEPPNVRPREEIDALRDEFRHNAFMVNKIRQLSDEHGYGFWRPVRGDGNCFYRAAIFGVLEAWLSEGALHRVSELVRLLQMVRYEERGEQCAHEEMLERLRTWTSAMQLERWVAADMRVDRALVRACRRLLRDHLVSHAEDRLPNGMTYLQYVLADGDMDGGGGDYKDVEDYCMRVVDPMGREAEFLAVAGFPASLGIGIRIWLLDRRADVDLTNTDWLGPKGNIDVHLLLKPGHYDILIPREVEPLN